MEDRPSPLQGQMISRGPRLAFLWLVLLFALGVGLRFLPRDQGTLEDDMRLPERLALVAKFGSDLPVSAREQLLEAARLAQGDDIERVRVLDDQPLKAEAIEKLPEGYRRMAEYQQAPSPEREQSLKQMAEQAQQRLGLCLGLLGALVLSALGLSFFAKTQSERPALPMASLPPEAVLGLFMAWDAGNVFGVGVAIDGFQLRKVLPPLMLILFAQMVGYGLFLLLLRLVRRPSSDHSATWNLSFPFPAAWVGRGYFACYGLVFTANVLIGALSGQAPTSSNPLLGVFMDAAWWQVWVLAILVVIVGPAFEELIFRGWLLGGLRERWGDTRAIVVSSAFFAVIHGDPWATPALFLLGSVFGWVYLRSGSLYASILLHAMWNATTFTFLLANIP